MQGKIFVKQSLSDAYRQYLEDVTIPMNTYLDAPEEFVTTKPSIYHSLRLQPVASLDTGKIRLPPTRARFLPTEDNRKFQDDLRDYSLPLFTNQGEPLYGRHVYPGELFSFNPTFKDEKKTPDLIPKNLTAHSSGENIEPLRGDKAYRRQNLFGFTGDAPTPQRFTSSTLQPEGIIYGNLDENDVVQINTKPTSAYQLTQVARALSPFHPRMDVKNLNENEQLIARDIMDAGIPPILAESNVDTRGRTHHLPIRLHEVTDVQEAHDPFAQYDMGNLNRPSPEGLEQFTLDSIRASEPMDIAMRLLKEDIDYQDEDYINPHEQIWNDEADEQLIDTTNSLWNYVENMSNDDKIEWLRLQGNPFMQRGMQRMYGDYPELSQQDIDDSIWEMMFDAWQDSQLEMPGGIDFDIGGNRKSGEAGDPVRAHAIHPNYWKKLASEPMDIAMRLLKKEPLQLRNSAELAELARQGDMEAYNEMMERTGDYYLANEITGEPDVEANLEAYGAETGKNPFKNPPIGRTNQIQIHQSPVTPIHVDKKLHNWQYKNASEPMEIAMQLLKEEIPYSSRDYPPQEVSISTGNPLVTPKVAGETPEVCNMPGCNSGLPPVIYRRMANPIRSIDNHQFMCEQCAYKNDLQSLLYHKMLKGEITPMEYTMQLLKRELHPGRDIEGYLKDDGHYAGEEELYNLNDPEVQNFVNRLHLDKQPPKHLLPFSLGMDLGYVEPELRVENRDTKLYHPIMMDEHEDLDKFPDRKIVEREDGTKEELVSTSNPTSDVVGVETTGRTLVSPKPTFEGIPFSEETGFTRSEPMKIAMQLLKERVSPEAKRHKLEYDKKYESSPERVKYREELNRERRRRHIMGRGGPDMSHTKDHTIVPESPHTNRARHFKDKGTLL